MIMDFLNVGLIFVFPAHWMWGDNGRLQKVGALDFAGSSVIHMSGGTIALVGAIMLGQRDQRFGKKSAEYKGTGVEFCGIFKNNFFIEHLL